MASAALLGSMSAVAANNQSFTASFVSADDITINGLQDVTLNKVDVEDGVARKSTPFCVGRAVTGNESLGFAIEVGSTSLASDNAFLLKSGNGANAKTMAYKLHHTISPTFVAADADEIGPGDLVFTGSTSQNIAKCDSNGRDIDGYVWVSIEEDNMAGAAGTYTDLVTLTVSAN